MRNLTLALAIMLGLTITLHAGEGTFNEVNVPVTAQTENTDPAQSELVNTDQSQSEDSESAKKKKRRKKKKKKNPVVKWVVGGAIAVAAIALYIVTDGEGYHSR